jgi:glycosyltransferase involved in cell wall biosynthesis
VTDRAPRFSIVIPTFDSEAFLSETLQSLAAQTHRDFEVILVDDGSRDGTLDLARADMRRLGLPGTAVPRPAGLAKGVASCRNAGIALSRGSWIAFLDSDDLFAPTKLERMADVIASQHLGASCRAICHPFARFSDVDGSPLSEIGRLPPGPPRRLLASLLTEGNWFATSAMLIERSLLEELGGFDVELFGVEDWWLVLQICARSPWAYVDEALTSLRIRERSLMQGRAYRHYGRQFAKLLRTARQSGDLSPDELAQLVAYVRTGAGRHYAASAVSRGRWGDVAAGCFEYVRAGFPGVGARILGLLLWRKLLATASGAGDASSSLRTTHTN